MGIYFIIFGEFFFIDKFENKKLLVRKALKIKKILFFFFFYL
jgi:hypothetical protein